MLANSLRSRFLPTRDETSKTDCMVYFHLHRSRFPLLDILYLCEAWMACLKAFIYVSSHSIISQFQNYAVSRSLTLIELYVIRKNKDYSKFRWRKAINWFQTYFV